MYQWWEWRTGQSKPGRYATACPINLNDTPGRGVRQPLGVKFGRKKKREKISLAKDRNSSQTRQASKERRGIKRGILVTG